jgi:hypothetical protein
MTASSTEHPGPGVDRVGNPVVDPTENVKALTEAAVKRIDDIANLRAEYTEKIAVLRAMYDEKLRLAESARIDAIRAVDVGAVQRASEVQGTVAEALRNQVATTQSAAQVALAAALDPIQKDIADLRRAQYEAQGQKTQIVETRASANYNLALMGFVIGMVPLIIFLVTMLVTK